MIHTGKTQDDIGGLWPKLIHVDGKQTVLEDEGRNLTISQAGHVFLPALLMLFRMVIPD